MQTVLVGKSDVPIEDVVGYYHSDQGRKTGRKYNKADQRVKDAKAKHQASQSWPATAGVGLGVASGGAVTAARARRIAGEFDLPKGLVRGVGAAGVLGGGGIVASALHDRSKKDERRRELAEARRHRKKLKQRGQSELAEYSRRANERRLANLSKSDSRNRAKHRFSNRQRANMQAAGAAGLGAAGVYATLAGGATAAAADHDLKVLRAAGADMADDYPKLMAKLKQYGGRTALAGGGLGLASLALANKSGKNREKARKQKR